MSETILELLHEHEKLTQKNADKIWDQICERSDGIDVENCRTEWGLYNKPSDRLRTTKNLQWLSKSKLTTKNWDNKQFFFQYVIGLKGSQNELMRSGSNNHLLLELIPNYVEPDEFKFVYDGKMSMKLYIKNLTQMIFTDIVNNAVSTEIETFDKALSVFEESESNRYKSAIECIAEEYQDRYVNLKPFYEFDKIKEYLFPTWREVVLWDYSNWTSGIVDAIFKVPYRNWRPVDYKFGNPKLKYYIEGISLEMTYYKHLIQGSNVKYAHSYFGDRKPWTSLYCDDGEMWYIMDTVNTKHRITFTDTLDAAYYKSIAEYWEDLNNLNFSYQKTYGWQKSRYDDFCIKLVDGVHDCEYYSYCKTSTTFRMANDPLWKDIF